MHLKRNYVQIDGIKRPIFDKPQDDDDEHKYEPIYIRRLCTPFECMMNQVEKMDLTAVIEAASYLREQIKLAREDPNLVEPLHVQLVGNPRQCKTQMALRILDVLKEFGFLCFSRTSRTVILTTSQRLCHQPFMRREMTDTSFIQM
jgi:hypothetical protein